MAEESSKKPWPVTLRDDTHDLDEIMAMRAKPLIIKIKRRKIGDNV
jgi:hypothetical protein